MTYAANTQVPIHQTRAEIERLLARYGADQFASGWTNDRAVLAFRSQGRQLRFDLPVPDRNSKEFTHDRRRIKRKPDAMHRAWEQACRQRWRALALVIKAKLEAVETGITTFESEFLAHIVTADGRTVGEVVLPEVAQMYATGRMPRALLPGLDDRAIGPEQ